MAIQEASNFWTLSTTTSTGGGKAFNTKGYAQSLSFYIETGAGCTATVQIQSRSGSSSGPYAVLSTTSPSTSSVNVVQFLGPLEWVRPYVTSKSTGDLTVRLLGN
jgi:hypothetical protein